LAAAVFIISSNLGLRDNHCRIMPDLDVPVITEHLIFRLICRAYAKYTATSQQNSR